MSADLYNKLISYAESGTYPFHMPGHKMGRGIGEYDIFKTDITEINGFDNLHNPDGIIKDAQEKYASLFGAKKTFFCVNGATGVLQAAIMSVCGPNDTVIMARNCHRSVYSAMILTGSKTVYVFPRYCGKSDMPGGILPEDIEKAVKANPNAKAVIITSPTAEGIVSDVEKIAEIAHRNNMVLIVDEAHGSHFKFNENFPKTALEMGADIVVQSAHKTLPAPTQTAVVHIGSDRADCERLRETLSITETSSPSYIFMAMLDRCRDFIEKNGKKEYADFSKFLIEERKKLKNLKNMELLDKDLIGKYGIKDIDISKIVVMSQKQSCVDIADILRKKYKMEMEMGCHGHFMAISTISDDREKISELIKNIKEIDENNFNSKTEFISQPRLINLEQKLTLKDAFYSPKEDVDFYKAEGRVSAEFVIPYPPGIPIISPGEVITKEVLDNAYVLYKSGVEITGVKNQTLEKLSVLR